uniref:Uncharacterized protein n=1 Tax=Triticum urartu TaxID=4572 RepID=A0A8R7JZD4_TRIUA
LTRLVYSLVTNSTMEDGTSMPVAIQWSPTTGGEIFLCCLLTLGRALEELTHTSQGGSMMCVR